MLTTKEFIEESKNIHGSKYDYSKVEYINKHTRVCIICPEHGEFWQTPSHHCNKKHGCPKCKGGIRYTIEEFIEKAKAVHGDKYDYSKVEYKNANTKICIVCSEHGEFWITPNDLLNGHGCAKCKKVKRLSVEEFIESSKKIHGDKYDYSLVKYKNIDTPVKIICPIHGVFVQKPIYHKNGHNGCPHCYKSYIEEEIKNILDVNNIRYEFRKKDFQWLKNKSNMEIDFYLPDYKAGIECQGDQHFKSKDFFGGESVFNEQIKRDILKKELCDENGINLYYYTNYKFSTPYQVYTDKNKLLEEILKTND